MALLAAGNIRAWNAETSTPVNKPAKAVQFDDVGQDAVVYSAHMISRARKRTRSLNRGAIYARFSTRFQHSIDDQVRTCLTWAEMNGVHVDPKYIFRDDGITGRSNKRPGFMALERALGDDEVDVVITFMTNRIYRKMYLSLKFVEENILDKNKRCVFVKQGIDTDDKKFFSMLLQVFALLDERQAAMIKDFVRAGQEGLLLKGWVHGTITYGYMGKPVDGPKTKQGRERTAWAINPTEAEWVKKIFAWFLGTEPGTQPMNYTAIARRLNRENAPIPRWSKKKRWTALIVKRVLRNKRYIGDWSYGWSEAVWKSKASYSTQVERDEPQMEHHRPDLRIIDDLTFYRAQERRAEITKGQGGRRKKGCNGDSLPHLFEKLFWCEKHKRFLWVSGKGGKSYQCPDCRASDEPFLYSLVLRVLAARLICEKVAALILADVALAPSIVEAFKRHATTLLQPQETSVEQLKDRRRNVQEQISFIYEAPAGTDADRKEKHARIAQLQAQRAELDLEIAEQAQPARKVSVPTERQVRARLSRLASILQRAAESDDIRVVGAAHEILKIVTGGKIELQQMGERKPQRGWLQARFTVDVLRLAGPDGSTLAPPPVVIDLKKCRHDMKLARRAKALFDQEKLVKEIATTIKRTVPQTRKLLAAAFEELGQVVPDGRSRRSGLKKKSLEPALFEKMADKAKVLWDQEMPLRDIGAKLKIDRTTLTKCLKHWFESRGLPYPDGRARRKLLSEKTKNT